MISDTLPYDYRHRPLRCRSLGWSVLRVLWQLVRLPVLAVLLVLEPFISLVLTAFSLLGIVLGLILKFSGDVPHFPFWLIIGFSLAAFLLLMAYHALIGILCQ